MVGSRLEVNVLALLLTSAAWAVTPEPTLDTAWMETHHLATAESNRGGQGRGKGKRGKRRQQAKPSWKHRFYARPLLTGSTFTDNAGNTYTAVGIGGEGGIRYWEVNTPLPRLRGRTRVAAQYITATDSSGTEVKVGSFLGPAWEYFALESGLDISWDKYEWGGVPMDETTGVGVPVIATTGVSIITVYGGFQPTWMNNEARRVDWDATDEFGFGHQFATFAGVSLAIDDMNVGVGYTRTVTSIGVQEGYGLTLGFRG